ncbi:MAG: hypothetical protein AAGC79_16145 [Pseudomonadota bacterium]
MMMVLCALSVVAAIAAVFAGKTVIAAVIAHIQETHPKEYERLSRHGVIFKAMQGDADRARRGIAGPLLTGFLPEPLRSDPVIQKAKSWWRLSFVAMIGFFILSLVFLSRAQ